MFININRYQDGKEKILTDEDINLLIDAIKNLLFEDSFFEASPWNTLKVNTTWIKPEEEDVNILSCHGNSGSLTEEQAQLLFDYQSQELGSYFKFLGNALAEVSTGIAIAIGGNTILGGIRIATGVLRAEDQAIFLLGSCQNEWEFSALSRGMCGLIHIAFKLLRAKYPIVKDGVPSIELDKYIDKSANDDIAERVANFLASERKSVERWKASLG